MSKKKKTFGVDLGEIGEVAKETSKSKIEQEFKIHFIDKDKIFPSEKNVYDVSNIDELAEDIRLNGLSTNLLVRPVGDKYELISGERRFRSMCKLYDEGDKKYSKIPCQVRELNDLDMEIVLYQSNATTRVLTNKELRMQVKRLKELYKEKKKRGEKISGRARENIANDLNVSSSTVSRIERIDKLIPELQEAFERDTLSLVAAYELASLSKEHQEFVAGILEINKDLTVPEIKEIKGKIKEIEREKENKEDIVHVHSPSEVSSSSEEVKTEHEKIPTDSSTSQGKDVNLAHSELEEKIQSQLKEIEKDLTQQNGEVKKRKKKIKLLNKNIIKSIEYFEEIETIPESDSEELNELYANINTLRAELEKILKR